MTDSKKYQSQHKTESTNIEDPPLAESIETNPIQPASDETRETSDENMQNEPNFTNAYLAGLNQRATINMQNKPNSNRKATFEMCKFRQLITRLRRLFQKNQKKYK